MDDLEKVETIRTKCNVSYTDAKAALAAADGNVLDAIIWLESQGKPQPTSAKSRAKRPTSPRRWTACGSTSKSSSA